MDYSPTISMDGRTLYFISNRKGTKWNVETNEFSHDIFVARKNHLLDLNFTSISNYDTSSFWGDLGINTSFNEGGITFSADERIAYFTGCNRSDGFGSCDLYSFKINSAGISQPVNLGKDINSSNWDSQPSLSQSSKRLYFASNRPGPNGIRNYDIWYCDYDFENEKFNRPKNLSEINTSGRENSPFIADDELTLYFSSDSHSPNYGGYDIYSTKFDPETNTWSKPESLGTKINSIEDDLFFSISNDGKVCYFSSLRRNIKGYKGNYDIFMGINTTSIK
jgi:Tol biopolymer transport system component